MKVFKWMKLSTDNPWSKSRNTIIFVSISIVQCIAVICMEGIIYGLLDTLEIDKESSSYKEKVLPLFSYLTIFIVSQVFQVIVSIESVVFKNTLQIFGLILFNIMSFIYSIFQTVQAKVVVFKDEDKHLDEVSKASIKFELIQKLAIAMASTIAFCQLLMLYAGFKCYQEFGWAIYRKTGSDLIMRRYYMIYHLLVMLLKFDAFFFFGFTLQFLYLALKEGDNEIPLTIASIPLAVIVVTLAILSVQRENKILAYISLFGLVCSVVYFAFKIFRIFTRVDYEPYEKFMSLFAFISLFFNLFTIILLVACLRNFNKGLGKYIRVNFGFSNEIVDRRTSLNLVDD